MLILQIKGFVATLSGRTLEQRVNIDGSEKLLKVKQKVSVFQQTYYTVKARALAMQLSVLTMQGKTANSKNQSLHLQTILKKKHPLSFFICLH
jgi:hypothetical protein